MRNPEQTCQVPFSHIVKGRDLKPLVVLLDGTRLPLDEWKVTRISEEEYFALMRKKRALPDEPEYRDEPNYEEGP